MRRTGAAGRAAVVATAVLTAACGRAAPPGLDDTGAPRLVDVTAAAGLDGAVHGAFRWGVSPDVAAMMGGGACWLDADGDGAMDLYLVSTWSQDEHARWIEEGGLPRSTLYRNVDGRFEDVGDRSGAALEIRGQGCLAADLDGDGHTDLYVTSDRSNVLLWNRGDGTFAPDDGAAGLDVYGWHTSATAGDVDGDGLTDVFVGGYVDPNARIPERAEGFPRSHQPVRDLLFLNRGAQGDRRAVFELATGAGIDADGPRYTLGAMFTDVDGDGDLDLHVANDTDPNRLYRNDSSPGRPVLVDIAPEVGADDRGSGMGVAAGDLDGDARDEVVVTNLGSQGHALLLGGAPGPALAFADGRDRLGVSGFGDGLTGWGVTAVDLDGDGWLELLLGNGDIPILDLDGQAQPLLVYGSGPTGLVDRGADLGVAELAPRNSRAVAVADVDDDGDPDVIVTSIGRPPLLLATVGSADGRGWLTVDPEGRTPGTVVEVVLPDGRTLRREVRAGSSYLSTEDPRATFGLGSADRVRVEVRWPDGATATVTDVAPGGVLTVARP